MGASASAFERRDKDAVIAYVRVWNGRIRNALRPAILQLSQAGEDGTEQSHNVLPRVGRADGDVVPRIRARFGVRMAQDARKDAPIEIDEVVQMHLWRQGG
jgi:hypothetical protein